MREFSFERGGLAWRAKEDLLIWREDLGYDRGGERLMIDWIRGVDQYEALDLDTTSG